MTHRFKVGDRVECIDSSDREEHLSYGKVYVVSALAYISNLRLAGVRFSHRFDRFRLAEPAKTRLYLAGKMRGIPFFNFPAFDQAAAQLRAAGYEVWSPAEHDREVYGEDFEKAYPTGEEDGDFDLRAALAYDTKMICEWADGIALLDGWKASAGASAEKALGEALGLRVSPCGAWVFEAKDLNNWHDGANVWDNERIDILRRFTQELGKATGDGSKKRQAGEKPPWYEDDSHLGAVFSHLCKWYRGEKTDPDSGASPLVHAAWRLLAIACVETGNVPE